MTDHAGANGPLDDAIAAAVARLDGASSIVALGHLAPDGDALGSALALAHSARASGRDAWAAFGEPVTITDSLAFLPLDLIAAPAAWPERPDVVVAFDTASFDRLGSTGGLAKRAGHLVVVDHHASNQGFGDTVVIDPHAGASAELAYQLIHRLGWPLTPEAATSLYVGIVSDTGRFQYSSTGPETLRIAAALLEAGVQPDLIGQNLYEKVPFGYLRLAAAVLGKARLEPEVSLVWSAMTNADLADAGLDYPESDPLIDDLRIAREAGVALLLKQLDGGWKASLRSRGELDVGSVAVTLGGGGHHNASGFSAEGPAEEVVASVRDLLAAQLRDRRG
jgi:phosphoesterase RecJ-like protein